MTGTISEIPSLQSGPESATKKPRVQSIDLLRGAIMVIMAIDHVRVYSGIPAGGPTPGIFFTRWVTHFCAPGFAFFAGTSAFLYLMKTHDKSDLTKFLITRGLLLVFLELTLIRFFWMFNLDFASFTFAGVIWMLGWCMVLLPAFINLRPITVGIVGVSIIAFQQIFAYVPALFPDSWERPIAIWWQVFYPPVLEGDPSTFPNFFGIEVFYFILPWIGVMMAGYAFGELVLKSDEVVRKWCLWIGLTSIVLFLAVGALIVTNQREENTPFILQLLDQQKYPPSQLYLLMTLGPLIALVPWAEQAHGWFARAIIMIGRVPMFFYLTHLLLIHLSAFVVNLIAYGTVHQDWYYNAPFVSVPEDQRWGLPLLYVVWFIDTILLYLICKAYSTYKLSHPEKKWLKYI